MKKSTNVGIAVIIVLLYGCGSDRECIPCVDSDPLCGHECEVDQDCSDGLYCLSNKCAKQCDSKNGYACPLNFICQSNGQCLEEANAPDGSTSDVHNLSAGSSGYSPAPPISVDASTGDDICAWNHVAAQVTIPTVILIVDQSGSMDSDFQGQGSRWNVLRDFLLEQPDGLIDQLQSQIRFGLALFSARSEDDRVVSGQCPELTIVPPDLNNYQAIGQVYSSQDPIDETPTGDAIDAIVEDLNINTAPDQDTNPIVFILATDGEPDRCEEPNPQNGQEEALAAVENAYELGVRTFFVWIGSLNKDSTRNHVQDVANAGVGNQPGEEDAEYWVAGDDASLRQALQDIIGGQLSCEIKLEGSVAEEDAHLGSVILNSTEISYDDENGWKWVSPNMIRLVGSACDALMSSQAAILSVSFPCQVEIGVLI